MFTDNPIRNSVLTSLMDSFENVLMENDFFYLKRGNENPNYRGLFRESDNFGIVMEFYIEDGNYNNLNVKFKDSDFNNLFETNFTWNDSCNDDADNMIDLFTKQFDYYIQEFLVKNIWNSTVDYGF